VKRVLITGASGFIGRYCLQPLLDRGYEVHAVARRPSGFSSGVNWHPADLLEEGRAAAIARSVNATHLLHLAWCAAPVDYLTNPANRQWAAVTLELAKAFSSAGGERLIGAGSCAEYASSITPCAEDTTPLHPMSLYGESKVTAYRQLAALAETTSLSFAWGRIFLPYGPYQAPARLIPSVITALLRQLPIPCPASAQMRDFIHVQDVADAFVALLDSDLTGACNFGSGLAVSIRDLVTLIARLVASENALRFDALPQRGTEPAFIVADTRRFCIELGWRPRLTLEDGLAQTIAWWRSNLSA
jgi:nucleoside-diphosphate-sugar epimerase